MNSEKAMTLESDLSAAAQAGNLEAIRSLLGAGADVRYVRPHGYTVKIDVMHGRPGTLLTSSRPPRRVRR